MTTSNLGRGFTAPVFYYVDADDMSLDAIRRRCISRINRKRDRLKARLVGYAKSGNVKKAAELRRAISKLTTESNRLSLARIRYHNRHIRMQDNAYQHVQSELELLHG